MKDQKAMWILMDEYVAWQGLVEEKDSVNRRKTVTLREILRLKPRS